MLRRILTVAFTAAALGTITAPAFASASASDPSYNDVHICASLNTNLCFSSNGIGTSVTLTSGDRTTYNVVSLDGTDVYLIEVNNEPTHCVEQGSGSIVTTTDNCAQLVAEWIYSDGHFHNAKYTSQALGNDNPPANNEVVLCQIPVSGFDWTWKLEQL
jgi:hypothetical protein